MVNRRFCILSLVMISSFLLCSTSYAKQNLEFALIEFAPIFYKEDGVFKGFVLEKLKKIVKHAGYEMNCGVYPMTRIAQLVRSGDIDLTAVLNVVFNERDVLISDKALHHIKLRAYKLSSRQIVKKKEDLTGKRVGIYRGFTYNGWLDYIKDPKNDVKYYEVASHEQLFKMLELGRLDYVLDYA